MIDTSKPYVDIFDDGRFIVGHFSSTAIYRHQYPGAPQLVLTYARYAHCFYRGSYSSYELMPEHYGVIRDDFDGALFKQVRSMGVRLPYWLSHRSEIIAEATINETAFAMLKLAFPQ